MSHNHKFRQKKKKKKSLQKLFCTGHVNCENTERLNVPSVMLIKYSLHVATYIRNLSFSFELVFLIIIAFIQTRSTLNAFYIKINKKTNSTNACYISVNYIWYSRLCSKTKLTVYKLCLSLSICMYKPRYVRDGSTVLDTGDLFPI